MAEDGLTINPLQGARGLRGARGLHGARGLRRKADAPRHAPQAPEVHQAPNQEDVLDRSLDFLFNPELSIEQRQERLGEHMDDLVQARLEQVQFSGAPEGPGIVGTWPHFSVSAPWFREQFPEPGEGGDKDKTPWQIITEDGDVKLMPAGGTVNLDASDLTSSATIVDVDSLFEISDGDVLYLELTRTPPAALSTATLTLEIGQPTYWPSPYDFDGDGKWQAYTFVLYEFATASGVAEKDKLNLTTIGDLVAIPRHPFASLVAMLGAFENTDSDITTLPIFVASQGSCTYV